uniref:Bestrophin homolog n=1 Tax=Acrobeloides nanus TaxID=290746 RepID=A0A914CL60_9BILA
MVLNQALVLRDISMQVRERFPTLETLIAAGLLTKSELNKLRKIDDVYSQYWTPIQWVHANLYKALEEGKIKSDKILDTMMKEVQKFRDGISSLLRYDWVPIPLVYAQVIFLAVRLYFIICLVSRQFIVPEHTKHKDRVDLWIPYTTILQFIVYMGWMEVAEALMNPLGDDDDDLECNYVIDKNLITGLTLVEQSQKDLPDLVKDDFWDSKFIVPLYGLNAADRSVHPLQGSASLVNLVKNMQTITMIPNRAQLPDLSEEELQALTKFVEVEDHNLHEGAKNVHKRHVDPDNALKRMKILSSCMNNPQTLSAPGSKRASMNGDYLKISLNNDIENGKR